MIVNPELISASSAPSASPLKSCETKFGQLIMTRVHLAVYLARSVEDAFREKRRRGPGRPAHGAESSHVNQV
ncbi:hypothetical protein ACVIHH_006713 [Bradyrhizobium sp. USDA 4518]